MELLSLGGGGAILCICYFPFAGYAYLCHLNMNNMNNCANLDIYIPISELYHSGFKVFPDLCIVFFI